MVRFELLAATGHERDAVALVDRQVTLPLTVSAVLLTLERAPVAERVRDRAMAIHLYQFVIVAWRNADLASHAATHAEHKHSAPSWWATSVPVGRLARRDA